MAATASQIRSNDGQCLAPHISAKVEVVGTAESPPGTEGPLPPVKIWLRWARPGQHAVYLECEVLDSYIIDHNGAVSSSDESNYDDHGAEMVDDDLNLSNATTVEGDAMVPEQPPWVRRRHW